jgi:DNA-binding transcriptional MerR regulator
MLKIGDFSKLAQVTVKTLHHYDHTGLLKPAKIDAQSGYRYYSVEQMARLNRILVLKDLGFSLDQIKIFLDEHLPASELRGMLKLKQAELEQQIETVQTRLSHVEARLVQIEREGKMPSQEVVLKQVDPIRVLSLREIVSSPACIGPFFLEIARTLDQIGIKSTGPWMALYHHGEYREFDLDLEAAIPVDPNIQGPIQVDEKRQMVIRTLPARLMANVICRMESQSDVYESNQLLCNWIEENQYQIQNAPEREVYVEAPQQGKAVIFEIQLAVEKESIPTINSSNSY